MTMIPTLVFTPKHWPTHNAGTGAGRSVCSLNMANGSKQNNEQRLCQCRWLSQHINQNHTGNRDLSDAFLELLWKEAIVSVIISDHSHKTRRFVAQIDCSDSNGLPARWGNFRFF